MKKNSSMNNQSKQEEPMQAKATHTNIMFAYQYMFSHQDSIRRRGVGGGGWRRSGWDDAAWGGSWSSSWGSWWHSG